MGQDHVKLEEARRRGEAAIKTWLKQQHPSADVFTFGAIDLNPGLLAVWVRTATDADRDRLASDKALLVEMRQLLVEAGYPPSALKSVSFTYESDETVKRDFGGNWWWAIK